ncbi:MAG: UDP-N-acetylglucosamine 2-epimerase [Cyanobacteria bacterium P01_G01_bin.54]
MKILFVTGSRGEWGYIRPILQLCKANPDVEYHLCVTNMHLLPAYGLSKQEIEQDGFKIHDPIYMSLDGYNHLSMVKSLGIFLTSFSDVLASAQPDWIMLAGDRGEQLMAAIAGGLCYIPVGHIQAGELSGNIDGMTRHAIGKYAHLHFAANEDAAQRLIRLGEEPFRVKHVGAPQVNELVAGQVTDFSKLCEQHSLPLKKQGYLLVVQHPVTEEMHLAQEQIQVTMRLLSDIALPKIVILPNNDAGSHLIREGIEQYRHGDFYPFANLKREEYLSFLKHTACLVGNSSSGLLEAPTFKVPVVNLGRRQIGRLRGLNAG